MSNINDASLTSLLTSMLVSDTTNDSLVVYTPTSIVNSDDMSQYESTICVGGLIYERENYIDSSKYRSEYNYADVYLSSYLNEESEGTRYDVEYVLSIYLNNAFHILERFNSNNGSCVIDKLLINQEYYITAIDVNNLYKSQSITYTPTEYSTSMRSIILSVYNNISDVGMSYTFILKNVIGDRRLYLIDQPFLKIDSLGKDKYAISGTPSTRDINLYIEYQAESSIIDTHTLSINGSTNPVKTLNYKYYEAPYRILKSSGIDVDSLISTENDISKLIIQSKRQSNRNLSDVLYVVNGESSYNKDIDVQYSTTFISAKSIDYIQPTFEINNIDGELNVGDVILVDDERMIVESYSNVTNIIGVVRGVDGTIPKNHESNLLIYVEKINISIDVFKNSTSFSLSTKTFSNETVESTHNRFTFIPTQLLYKPHPPINIKFNGVYRLDEILDDLILSGKYCNKNDVVGFYDEDYTSTQPNGFMFEYAVSDDNDVIKHTDVIGSLNNINIPYDDVKTDYLKIDIKSVYGEYRSATLSYRIKIFTPVYNITGLWDDISENIIIDWEIN